jgi:hypothetical protein
MVSGITRNVTREDVAAALTFASELARFEELPDGLVTA